MVFDFVGWRSRDEGLRRGLHAAGLASAVLAVAGGFGAVASGLAITHGHALGSGYERMHHLFVWPAFALCVGLVAWRLFRRTPVPYGGFGIYLGGMGLASALMLGAGFWGGELVLGAEANGGTCAGPTQTADRKPLISRGHQLFLLNCAHCHAQDATGDEGPDLHGVLKSDARIAGIITNGVKGQMPKFRAKLSDPDVKALIAFIRSLRGD